MAEDPIYKEIKELKDSKLDKILLEDVNTNDLDKLDLSSETAAVKATISTLKNLIAKLKSK